MRRLLVVLAMIAALAVGQESEEVVPSPLAPVVPRLETAEAQLAHARRLKQLRAGESAEVRAFWRLRAVDAYRAVRLHHPEARRTCSEAAFRAGELLRAAREATHALAEFEVAYELGRGTEFRARSRLEIGHLHRRAGRSALALDAYLCVASDPASARAHADEAWLRAGLAWRDAGRLEDARRAWRRVAEHGVDPLDRIHAFDHLGMLWVERGDLEAAAGVLNECLRALADAASEETANGTRVRRGLGRMRLVEELPRRVARRKGLKRAGKDHRETLDKMERLFHRMHSNP